MKTGLTLGWLEEYLFLLEFCACVHILSRLEAISSGGSELAPGGWQQVGSKSWKHPSEPTDNGVNLSSMALGRVSCGYEEFVWTDPSFTYNAHLAVIEVEKLLLFTRAI